MPDYLKMPQKQQILALLALGWGFRRIEAETGVRRETVGRYDRQRLANTHPPNDRRRSPHCGERSRPNGKANDLTCGVSSTSCDWRTAPGERTHPASSFRALACKAPGIAGIYGNVGIVESVTYRV